MASLINSLIITLRNSKTHFFVSFLVLIQFFPTMSSLTLGFHYLDRWKSANCFLFNISFINWGKCRRGFFLQKDKFIIQNDYREKTWLAYEIWKDYSFKNWNSSTVCCCSNLLKILVLWVKIRFSLTNVGQHIFIYFLRNVYLRPSKLLQKFQKNHGKPHSSVNIFLARSAINWNKLQVYLFFCSLQNQYWKWNFY